MTTLITDQCIRCGACVEECPNQAISERPDTFYIDPNRCTECVGFHERESCQAVCPVECCLPDMARRESEHTLLERALFLHPDDEILKTAAAKNDYPSHFRVQKVAN